MQRLYDDSKPEKKNILEISKTLSENPQISKITPQHYIDWNNSQILEFETDSISIRLNKVRIKRSSRVKFGLGWKRMKKKKVSKDFCQECSKRVDDNDNALCSEACSIWFHIQCIKVPE